MRRIAWPLLLVVLGTFLAACDTSSSKGGNTPPKPEAYTVSGTILDEGGSPIPNVTVSFGGAAEAVTTGADGRWTRSGLTGAVTVTPAHEAYAFAPASRVVDEAADDVDFTGALLAPAPYAVSGTVTDAAGDPIAGVAIGFSGLTETVETDADGAWASPELSGAVVVTPAHPDFVFEPSEARVTGPADDVDFTGRRLYTVFGTVADADGAPIAGVEMRFSGSSATADTDSDGAWSSPKLHGEVTVTPHHADYRFVPGERAVTETDAGTSVDFIGYELFTASGRITDDQGDPVPGVSIRIVHEGVEDETSSDADGSWEYGGLFGTVTVTAVDPAYAFTPPTRQVTAGAASADFRGALQPCSAGDPNDPLDPCVITRLRQLPRINDVPSGHYRLGADIDATPTREWNRGAGFAPLGKSTRFTGSFDGAGHTISGLFINRPAEINLGLFAFVGVNDGDPEDNGSIENVTLLGVEITGRGNVGGLVGWNHGSITNASVSGVVTVDPDGGGPVVGGLAARNAGIVTNSRSAGRVEGNTSVGGLLGTSYGGGVTASHSDANVVGRHTVGGLVGSNSGPIVDSYSTGAVTGSSDVVGGLAGINAAGGAITRSHSSGEVTGARRVGGLVGDNSEGRITTSRSSSAVHATSMEAGGLVGSNSGQIQISFSTGSVQAPARMGGLVGYNGPTGLIEDSYSASAVAGNSYAGGLVGYNSGGTITNAYSTGRVGDGAAGSSSVGGLIGVNGSNGPVTASYWDTQSSGQPESAAGEAKTTAEMQQQATYAGWDFTDVWTIDEGAGYPELRDNERR